MSFLDLCLIIIIGGFALFGFWFGLIHTLGSLLGTVVGVFLASRWYDPLANWLAATTGWTDNTSRVIMFVITFIIINRLIGFVFFLVDRLFSIVTRLPFINSLNRMLGIVFGLAEGIIVVGIIVFFISKFPLSDSFMFQVENSHIAAYCAGIASILWPLIPGVVKSIQGFHYNWFY